MKKILIVDDSSYMRLFVKKIIQKGGSYALFEASTKDDAIEMVKTIKPDIVILDLNMSEDRMDGLHVLTDITNINSEVATIVISAVGYEDVKEKCIELGAKSYIKKPIDAEILLQTLKQYL